MGLNDRSEVTREVQSRVKVARRGVLEELGKMTIPRPARRWQDLKLRA